MHEGKRASNARALAADHPDPQALQCRGRFRECPWFAFRNIAPLFTGRPRCAA